MSSPSKVEGKCDKCDGELYQRADDVPDTVRKRIDVYLDKTTPLIDYYSEAGKLIEINGEGEIDGIGESLIKALS